MSNLERYKDIFKRIFNVEDNELNENFTFDNLDRWDSLTHITLISELEDTFEVMFETEDILHFGGYENGMKILARYGIEI